MSKICGFIKNSNSQRNVEEDLRTMISVMKHNAGSYEEFRCFANGGIAVIRNASFDDNRSIWSKDRSSCLALAGEIVTHEDTTAIPCDGETHQLGETDLECLLISFETYGEEILEKLDGVFCFAYYNAKTDLLTIANDRYGFSPLYYYHDADGFRFASEVKAILRIIEQREPDWEAYADFFYIGHMIGEKTLFKNICALESGQIVRYSNRRLQRRRHYDFTRTSVLRRAEVSTEKLASLFIKAVQRRIKNSNVNTLLLSGGFDSRLILGALTTLGVKPKIVALEHAIESKGADGKLALIVANYFGLECDFRRTRQDFYVSKSSLEVFYILDGMVPTWELFIGEVYQELASEPAIVWDGLALDVALGGSHQYADGVEKNIARFIEKRAVNRPLLKQILTNKVFHSLDKSFMRRIQHEIEKIPASENRFLYFLLQNRTRRRIAINPYQLFATKVRLVTPAADRDLMDYVLSIPSSLKLNHKVYVDVMKRHFPGLAKVPAVSGGHFFDFRDADTVLKKKPIGRKKQLKNFLKRIPGVLKIKKVLYELIHGRRILSCEEQEFSRLIIAVLRKRYFDRPFYNKAKLIRLFTRYCNGNNSYHDLFMIVFYIELWHLLFVDEEASVWLDFRAERGIKG